jgi:purine-nucleoside phosphorylase
MEHPNSQGLSAAAGAAALLRGLHPSSVNDAAIIVSDIFSGVADLGERFAALPYSALPGFPVGEGVERGEAIAASIEGAAVLILRGRPTFYETGDPSLMASPMETLSMLGVRAVLCAGVALSAHHDIMPGSPVLITDHINLTGLNPLIGAYAGGRARINMNDAYDKRLQRRMKAATTAGIALREGVLMWFSGPSYETPAEVKFARHCGADLVGWTIAPEAILARRYNLPFLGLAVVSEFAAGVGNGRPGADVASGPAVAGAVATKRLIRSFFKVQPPGA